MARWHEASCEAPDVVVEENLLPRCRSCQRSCSLIEDLKKRKAIAPSTWTLPPDEPEGQMDLWWPKSVKYVGTKTHPDHEESPLVGAEEPSPIPTSSHIYGDTLGKDEIRLACLSAVPYKDYPIHISLEIYPCDDCPEYECTSYTWGGETGDSELCRPIYVGEYWDVILQTKNCYSMLQFARPWRGVRMLWVDAISINQGNVEERNIQVANMRRIYEECSRVMVYLGEDIVSASTRFPISQSLDTLYNTTFRRPLFPPYHPCNQAYNEKPFDLEKVLRRKYFSRVWVIQELIVSERAIIRVGDIDFRANPSILARISRPVSEGNFDTEWNHTAAPWVQFLGQGAFPRSQIKNIIDLAQLTAKSCASDPRDRLFGVISLLQDPSILQSLAPDYSLSFKHFCIGLFAHLLSVDKRYWFLHHAGIVARSHCVTKSLLPSWVPLCEFDQSWSTIMLAAPKADDLSELIASSDFAYFQISLDKSPQGHTWKTDKHMFWSPIYSPNPTVDAASGMLLINVVHLLPLRDDLLKEEAYDQLKIYSIPKRDLDGSVTKSKLLLVSLRDLEIDPTRDHLVLLRFKDSSSQHSWKEVVPCVTAILRRQIDKPNFPTFELVTASLRLYKQEDLPRKSQLSVFLPPPSDILALCSEDYQDAESWSAIRPIETNSNIFLTVATAIKSIQKHMDHLSMGDSDEDKEINAEDRLYRSHFFLQPATQSYFPGAQKQDDLLRIILRWFEAHYNGKDQINAFLDCIEERFRPEITMDNDRTYLVLTLDYDEWVSRLRYIYSAPRANGYSDECKMPINELYFRYVEYWQWKYERGRHWHAAPWGRSQHPDPQWFESRASWRLFKPRQDSASDHVKVRIDQETLKAQVSGLLRPLAPFHTALRHTSDPPLDVEALFHMIRNGPTKEQESQGISKYIDGVKIDGSVWRVGII